VLPGLLADLDGLGATERAALARPIWHPAVLAALASLEHTGRQPAELPALGALTWLGPLWARLVDLRRTAGLAGPAAVRQAALDALNSDSTHPAMRARGVVVLGDRDLTPDIEEVIRRFCADRTARVVLPPPLDHLEPAPGGLRAAADSAPIIPFSELSQSGSGHLRQTWRRASVPPAAHSAPSSRVDLVRCPDTDREALEMVREALEAVRAGVPLDRIAMAPSAAEQVPALREALDIAALPYVALQGPSLLARPAGRAARLVLDIAAGDESASTVHLLLTAPGVSWRRVVGGPAPRGRWRGLLARAAVSDGLPSISRALAWLAEPAEPDPTFRPACDNLLAALREIEGTVADLRAASCPGDLAQVLVARVATWLIPGPDRAAYLAHLQPLLRCRVPVEWRTSRTLVDEALGQAVPHGTLADPGIRVLDPMNLIGSEYDLVIGLGLAAGALPARPQEDPLLPDELRTALRARGWRIPESDSGTAREDRRFAALLSACAGRLVLSTPAWEVLEARPILPSPYLLEVQANLTGQPCGYADLERMLERRGSRERALPEQPDRATSAGERRAARAWRGGTAASIAAHPGARAVLAAAWFADPARYHADQAFNAWHGRIEGASLPMPGWTSEGSAWAVGDLSLDPQRYYIRHVLGARTPIALPVRLDPGDGYAVFGWLARVARHGFADGDGLRSALRAELEHLGLDPGEQARVLSRVRVAVGELSAWAPAVPAAAVVSGPVPQSPGWTITGEAGLTSPAAQLWTIGRAGITKVAELAEKAPALVFQAACTLGPTGRVAYVRPGGATCLTTTAEAWGAVQPRWERHRMLAEQGLFPTTILLGEIE
jgi:hypothetical protein